MDMPEPGIGDVEIELDGKTQTMVPTLEACIAISRIAGGGYAAVSRCLALDFDTICAVIEAGLGLNPVQAKKIRQSVYDRGTINLHGKCVDFIHIVNNGGRPPDPEEEQETAADPPPPPSQ